MSDELADLGLILDRIQSGDLVAWNEFVERVQQPLLAKARQLLNNSRLSRRMDPEDLVNDCLKKVWEAREKLNIKQPKRSFAYVLRILKNEFINECRPMNLEQTATTWQLNAPHSDTPSQQLMSEELDAAISASLASLDTDHQRVLIYRHLENKKLREIAEIMNIPIYKVGRLHDEAMSKFLKLMEAS